MALYVTGISTPEVHPEFPPRLGTLTRGGGDTLRTAAVAGLVVAAIVLAAVPAQAGRQTFTVSDCRHVEIRPERIMFACADGDFYATHLEWQRWRPFRAFGQGLFHQNDCRPSCAEGTFHARRGRPALRRRLWCPKAHAYVFRRATVVYRQPLLGRVRSSFRLFCPI